MATTGVVGLIKGKNQINYDPIELKLFKKLEKKNINNSEATLLVDFILKLLIYKPEDRPSASECLKHEWFITDSNQISTQL